MLTLVVRVSSLGSRELAKPFLAVALAFYTRRVFQIHWQQLELSCISGILYSLHPSGYTCAISSSCEECTVQSILFCNDKYDDIWM